MVFPSRGCTTCKSRRVKCDSARPVCRRCQRACRDCAWDQDEAAGLLFKNENAFARGRPRRPWKPRERKEAATVSTPSDSASVTSGESSFSVDDEVSQVWLENYVFRGDEMPEFAREYTHDLAVYWDRAKPGSSLRLAVAAVSHAILGRRMGVDNAAEVANSLFAQSFARVQREFREVSLENIDELIIATMLIASYENVLSRDMAQRTQQTQEDSLFSTASITGLVFFGDSRRYKAAADLLKLRRERGWAPNPALDRAARQELIRTCILRATPVDEWLRDEALPGQQDPVSSLDSLVVRVAALRSSSLALFLPKGARFESELRPSDMAAEARTLCSDLESWSRTVPEHWKFSVECLPESGTALDGLVHVYPTRGHGVIWNRYRATHLVVSSIRRRALAAMEQCSLVTVSTIPERELCLEKTASLATDMCRSIPSFVTPPAHSAQDTRFSRTFMIGNREIYSHDEIVPKLATLLAWPLIVATCTDGVPEPQRLWLQETLGSMSSILGDGVLGALVENISFKF
ncbi:hypothetical protein GGR52DRAFT_205729 [Hypoxylon sp. FL1284]|nr:hypothetical protein GGR52DRAFT_205729 [Hypoxylon sp. FL1284]